MSKWIKKPLGELLELVIDHRGKTPKKMGFDDFHESGYPVLSAKHVKTDGLANTDAIRFSNEEMYRKWMKQEVQEGDIVLTSEAPMGEAFYIDGTTKYLLGQRVFGLRPKVELIEPLYLLAWLTSRNGQKQLESRSSGSTVLGIKQSELLKLEVEVPPKDVQLLIAKNRQDLSLKIELNRQTNQTLEYIAQAIFKSWFVDFEPTRAKIAAKQIRQARHDSERSAALREALLADDRWPKAVAAAIAEGDPERAAMASISGKSLDELDQLSPEQQEQLITTAALFPDALVESELGGIPEGWEAKPLYETAKYINGNAFKTKDFSSDGSGLPIVKIVELKNGLSEGTKYTTGEFREKYSIKNDDVLYSWSGSPETSLEVFKWFGGDAWLNQHIFKLNFESEQQRYFAYYLLKHMKPILIATAQQKQTTGLGHVTVADMKRLLVSYPDVNLLKQFKSVIASMYDQCSSLDKEVIELSNLRDALLPKLLSGEIEMEAVA